MQIYNPFRGFKNTPYTQPTNISLVDGGEDGQTVPLAPLLTPARQMDLIIALDANSDTDNGWSAGYSLIATYQRFTNFSSTFGEVPMPKIPDLATFVSQGLNTRPTFFGCDSSRDVVNGQNGRAPIIAFVANYPWTTMSNYSTTQIQFSSAQSQAGLDNGAAAATLGGSPDWATCLACASIQRGLERSNTPRPNVCQSCFDIYCWNGQTNAANAASGVRNGTYNPAVGTPSWVTQNAGRINRAAGNVNAAPRAAGDLPAVALLAIVGVLSAVLSHAVL